MIGRKIRMLIVVSLFAVSSRAQFMEGYVTSNYAGVNGVNYNTSSIVDSRTKLDINFFTASVTFDNNYIGVNKNWVNPRDSSLFEYAVFKNDGAPVNALLSADILGPSFLMTIDEKRSFAFTTQFRSLTNFNNVSADFANLYYSELEDVNFIGASINTSNSSIEHASWNEAGVTYAQEVYKNNHHWISVGGRLKLIQGVQAAAIQMGNLTVEMNADSTVAVNGQDIHYLTSSNLHNQLLGNLSDFSNLGVGVDLGFTYEWRAKPDSLTYEMDGKQNPAREMSKHKFRIGVALTDIGYVNYKTGSSGRVNATSASWDPNSFDLSVLSGFEDAINDEFSSSENYDSYKMSLPSAISLQADYNIAKGFFINASYFKSLSNESKVLSVRYKDRLTITPRWDWKWMGVYLPFSIEEGNESHVGVNLMFGPFLIGTRDVGAFLWKDENYYANVHFGVKVTSLHYRPADFDGDKVSDQFDKCVEFPGIWAFKGCPDRDGDSIPDATDKCPDVAGLVQFKGCPDSDGDGVTDMEDECPYVTGVKDLHGCPDQDGDGIKDSEDQCPNEIGLEFFDGCPDTDGDSLIDRLDMCPELFGDRLHQGCPDTDKDGVFDHLDSCALTPGKVDNNGCPYKDDDGDGVVNKKDKCPTEAGPASNGGCPLLDQDGDGVVDANDDCPKTAGEEINNGCPVLLEGEEEIIDFAFKNLHFETGKSVILVESYPSLNALAELLKARKTWKLKLEGHTDDVGDAQDNLKLSKERVEATKAYLVSKGVDPGVLVLKYYGETKPVAENETEEGRQQNRRVEMEIVFE